MHNPINLIKRVKPLNFNVLISYWICVRIAGRIKKLIA